MKKNFKTLEFVIPHGQDMIAFLHAMYMLIHKPDHHNKFLQEFKFMRIKMKLAAEVKS